MRFGRGVSHGSSSSSASSVDEAKEPKGIPTNVKDAKKPRAINCPMLTKPVASVEFGGFLNSAEFQRRKAELQSKTNEDQAMKLDDARLRKLARRQERKRRDRQ